MSNKKTKRLLISFSLLNVALLGVCGYAFFFVQTKTIETAALYDISHTHASDKEKTQALARTLKETEKDRRVLSEYFVSKTSAVTFIEQIENIGKNAGVSLKVSSVSDEAKGSGGVQLSFSANGPFPEMYRLIALIESMPYKVTVKRANIQKMEGQGSVVWSGDFAVTLESFVQENTSTTTTKS
jgi:hypothetical protein